MSGAQFEDVEKLNILIKDSFQVTSTKETTPWFQEVRVPYRTYIDGKDILVDDFDRNLGENWWMNSDLATEAGPDVYLKYGLNKNDKNTDFAEGNYNGIFISKDKKLHRFEKLILEPVTGSEWDGDEHGCYSFWKKKTLADGEEINILSDSFQFNAGDKETFQYSLYARGEDGVPSDAILMDTKGGNWIFSFKAGVLFIPDPQAENIKDKINKTKKPYFSFTKYAGKKGISNLNVAGGASDLNGLTDAKSGGTNFNNSLLIGHSGTGTLDNATFNTGVGIGALSSLTSGNRNTAIGKDALYYNTTGSKNTASGVAALVLNTTGNHNTASGMEALLKNTIGNHNTASGYQALYKNTTGGANTALGYQAGKDAIGSANVYIGYKAGFSAEGEGNLYISSDDNDLITGNFFTGELTLGNTAITNNKFKIPSAIGTSNQVLTLSNTTTGETEWATAAATTSAAGGGAIDLAVVSLGLNKQPGGFSFEILEKEIGAAVLEKDPNLDIGMSTLGKFCAGSNLTFETWFFMEEDNSSKLPNILIDNSSDFFGANGYSIGIWKYEWTEPAWTARPAAAVPEGTLSTLIWDTGVDNTISDQKHHIYVMWNVRHDREGDMDSTYGGVGLNTFHSENVPYVEIAKSESALTSIKMGEWNHVAVTFEAQAPKEIAKMTLIWRKHESGAGGVETRKFRIIVKTKEKHEIDWDGNVDVALRQYHERLFFGLSLDEAQLTASAANNVASGDNTKIDVLKWIVNLLSIDKNHGDDDIDPGNNKWLRGGVSKNEFKILGVRFLDDNESPITKGTGSSSFIEIKLEPGGTAGFEEGVVEQPIYIENVGVFATGSFQPNNIALGDILNKNQGGNENELMVISKKEKDNEFKDDIWFQEHKTERKRCKLKNTAVYTCEQNILANPEESFEVDESDINNGEITVTIQHDMVVGPQAMGRPKLVLNINLDSDLIPGEKYDVIVKEETQISGEMMSLVNGPGSFIPVMYIDVNFSNVVTASENIGGKGPWTASTVSSAAGSLDFNGWEKDNNNKYVWKVISDRTHTMGEGNIKISFWFFSNAGHPKEGKYKILIEKREVIDRWKYNMWDVGEFITIDYNKNLAVQQYGVDVNVLKQTDFENGFPTIQSNKIYVLEEDITITYDWGETPEKKGIMLKHNITFDGMGVNIRYSGETNWGGLFNPKVDDVDQLETDDVVLGQGGKGGWVIKNINLTLENCDIANGQGGIVGKVMQSKTVTVAAGTEERSVPQNHKLEISDCNVTMNGVIGLGAGGICGAGVGHWGGVNRLESSISRKESTIKKCWTKATGLGAKAGGILGMECASLGGLVRVEHCYSIIGDAGTDTNWGDGAGGIIGARAGVTVAVDGNDAAYFDEDGNIPANAVVHIQNCFTQEDKIGKKGGGIVGADAGNIGAHIYLKVCNCYTTGNLSDPTSGGIIGDSTWLGPPPPGQDAGQVLYWENCISQAKGRIDNYGDGTVPANDGEKGWTVGGTTPQKNNSWNDENAMLVLERWGFSQSAFPPCWKTNGGNVWSLIQTKLFTEWDHLGHSDLVARNLTRFWPIIVPEKFQFYKEIELTKSGTEDIWSNWENRAVAQKAAEDVRGKIELICNDAVVALTADVGIKKGDQGWEEIDNGGFVYYYNHDTGVSTTDRPAGWGIPDSNKTLFDNIEAWKARVKIYLNGEETYNKLHSSGVPSLENNRLPEEQNFSIGGGGNWPLEGNWPPVNKMQIGEESEIVLGNCIHGKQPGAGQQPAIYEEGYTNGAVDEGDFSDLTQTFKGRLKDVRIWNIALTNDQINVSMEQSEIDLVENLSSLVSDWKCNESKGNTLQNSVSGGKHATIKNIFDSWAGPAVEGTDYRWMLNNNLTDLSKNVAAASNTVTDLSNNVTDLSNNITNLMGFPVKYTTTATTAASLRETYYRWWVGGAEGSRAGKTEWDDGGLWTIHGSDNKHFFEGWETNTTENKVKEKWSGTGMGHQGFHSLPWENGQDEWDSGIVGLGGPQEYGEYQNVNSFDENMGQPTKKYIHFGLSDYGERRFFSIDLWNVRDSQNRKFFNEEARAVTIQIEYIKGYSSAMNWGDTPTVAYGDGNGGETVDATEDLEIAFYSDDGFTLTTNMDSVANGNNPYTISKGPGYPRGRYFTRFKQTFTIPTDTRRIVIEQKRNSGSDYDQYGIRYIEFTWLMEGWDEPGAAPVIDSYTYNAITVNKENRETTFYRGAPLEAEEGKEGETGVLPALKINHDQDDPKITMCVPVIIKNLPMSDPEIDGQLYIGQAGYLRVSMNN